jgi:hypothetical protein
MIKNGELNPSIAIWRYLTFKKFVSFLELKALWFAKLANFEDLEEGAMPGLARQQLKHQHHQMEAWFPDEQRRAQVRRFVEDNEQYGRDLIVASRWFASEQESPNMWTEYAKGPEGIVIRSSPAALDTSLVQSLKDKWWIGKVRYVDLATHHEMDAYEAHQAHLRAFLKGRRVSHENEVRVATMNFVAPGCLNPDGSPQSEKQRRGFIDASNGPGIYVQANLSGLVSELRTAPAQATIITK